MRNRNPERKITTLKATLDAHFHAKMKNLNIALPAIIQSYDPTSKRAKVLPAIDTLFATGKSQAKPPLANVPVLMPSGGGFTATFPLRKGDAVMLLVSQRGIAEFKKAYKRVLPTRTSFFSLVDAVAIPGFGGRNITPAKPGTATLQTESGTDFVSIGSGSAEIRTTGTLTIDASTVNINARHLNITRKS